MEKKIKAALFDCDGVIINSAADISDAVNASLKHFRMTQLSYAKLKTFVGNGARALIERAVRTSKGLSLDAPLPVEEKRLQEILKYYLDYYYSHAIIKTKLYPGFAKAAQTLYESGVKLGIVTNKPTNILLEILEYFKIAKYFEAPIGADKVKELKPAPEGIFLALKTLGANPKQAIMVGDSYTDIGAGHAAGTFTAACLKGMGDKKAMLAQKPELILGYAAEIAPAILLSNMTGM
ncbi:MAG: HAD-IA family hydrolase [Treponema sp.]|nr:HAD-IA family hydrolase [Treponema sp.]